MNTFLRLNLFTVCLGFALMLMVDTTYAVEVSMETAVSEPPGPQGYLVGKVLEVTFRPREDGKTPEGEQLLDITVAGGLQRVADSTGTTILPNSANNLMTTSGELSLWVKVTGGTSGAVTGTWRAKNNFTQRVDFRIYTPPPPPPQYHPQLVVLPPIPCVLNYGEHDNMPTPLSDSIENLKDIKTHEALLEELKPLRDELEGLAARWDDPDPAADPKDMDSPPNMFRVPIVILNAQDLAGWHFDIAYNPQILEVVEVSAGNYAIFEGDFLKQDTTITFFQEGSVLQAFGRIIRISQSSIAEGDVNDPDTTPKGFDEWQDRIVDRKTGDDSIPGANGTGELVSICFRVKEFAEESLGLHNVQLSDSVGMRLNYTTIVHPVVVTHQFAPEDVNRDTVVNIKDLVIIASNLGLAKPINPRADVNNDGIVNALDLVIVAQHISDRTPAVEVRDRNVPAPAIPGSVATLDSATIQGWIDRAQVAHDGSAIFDLGIANLEDLLASRVPSETKLLLNYPNPFNPETWMPYQLAEATEVTISIYSVNGTLIRILTLGHQAAGIYQSKSQAAYWDGRNELGEQVASGVYFYTLTAGNFSATGKMLVRK